MSRQQTMNDFIVNPKTGRLLKKNSKTHKKLISAGLLNQPISTPEENLLIETSSPEEAKTLQSKMNKKALPDKVITRRGTKVLKANRRLTRKETIDKVSDIAIESVLEHKNEILEQDMTDNECENYIKNLILLKLTGHEIVKKVSPEPEPVQISTRQKLRFELDE